VRLAGVAGPAPYDRRYRSAVGVRARPGHRAVDERAAVTAQRGVTASGSGP